MRNKIARKILEETPLEKRLFVKKYADIVIRINQLLKTKGWNQQQLSQALDKRPSEISKWVNGDHNFTLKSLSKLEAELGADIIYVPRSVAFKVSTLQKIEMTVYKNTPVDANAAFTAIQKFTYAEKTA
jgi:transcriptional regulator with XRE-family HTH domain